jgi:phosphotransferase system HPr (HPr) family protein
VGETAEATVEVKNQQGLHVRVCELIAKAAHPFLSKVTLADEGGVADARSVISLSALGAGIGTRLILRAEGPDADAAVKAIAALFESKFGEE